jgi:hypothetical protein
MDMIPQDIALAAAGLIGAVTAVIHGVIVQKMMVRPIEATMARDAAVLPSIRRLVSILLHFSTACWLVGGLALIAAAAWAGEDLKRWVGVFAGGLFLYGVVGNFMATRGRHPGWMLMAAAIGLIVWSLI